MSVFYTDGIMSYGGKTYRYDNNERKWRPIERQKNGVESVKVFNDKVVVVEYFEDGVKKRVRAVCQDGDNFDLEKGLLVCYLKMHHGSKWQDDIRAMMELYEKPQKKAEEVQEKKESRRDASDALVDFMKAIQRWYENGRS